MGNSWVARLAGMSCVWAALSACVSEYDFGKKPVTPTIPSSEQEQSSQPASEAVPATISIAMPGPVLLPEEAEIDSEEESSAAPVESASLTPTEAEATVWSNCTTQTIQQPSSTEEPYPLDLTFIIDTSKSMDDEIPKVTAGLQAYLEGLDESVDTQVALITADFAASATGQLFSANGVGPVLKLVPGGQANPNAGVYTSGAALAAAFSSLLSAAMAGDPVDTELGLRSIYNSLRNDLSAKPNILTNNQKLGFFRSDAALAFITVADELDICARNADGSRKTTQSSEYTEYDSYCLKPSITPASVLASVEEFQAGRPFNISGIHYLPETAGKSQEIGYGYIELIDSVGGTKIDMTSASYTTALNQVAIDFSRELAFTTSVQFADPGVESDSIQVEIDGVPSSAFTYDSASLTLHLQNAGGANSRINITYCTE
ncbi:MAG: hypothetical protein AAB425_03645 [Bdellovibrionota bacterium]